MGWITPLRRAGWLRALAALVSACLLAGPVSAGDAPAALDPDALETARSRIRKLAESGGPFEPIEGRWDLIEEPDVALAWALHEDEPFDTRTLDALERIVVSGPGSGHRFVLAAFLYRYGRQIGRDLLIAELSAGARRNQAAVVLAMNQEKLAADGIGVQFRATKRPHKRLIAALGAWTPAGTALLVEGFSRDARHREEYLRAFAQADHRPGKAVVREIERLYENSEGGTRARAGAALLRLRPGSARPGLLATLRSAIRSGDALYEAEAVRALGLFGDDSDHVIYRRLVLELLAAPPVASGGWASSGQLAAAELLAVRGGSDDVDLVLRVMDLPGLQGAQSERLAVALVGRKDPVLDGALERRMGDGFVARVLRLSRLRSLPPEILPVPNRSLAETVVRANQEAAARRVRRAG